ncbi:MAG: hypothetical protein JWR86_2733, partial [Enterovirga sp.]|nr:hypothetical protein [Enterovirga sp.]
APLPGAGAWRHAPAAGRFGEPDRTGTLGTRPAEEADPLGDIIGKLFGE